MGRIEKTLREYLIIEFLDGKYIDFGKEADTCDQLPEAVYIEDGFMVIVWDISAGRTGNMEGYNMALVKRWEAR